MGYKTLLEGIWSIVLTPFKAIGDLGPKSMDTKFLYEFAQVIALLKLIYNYIRLESFSDFLIGQQLLTTTQIGMFNS